MKIQTLYKATIQMEDEQLDMETAIIMTKKLFYLPPKHPTSEAVDDLEYGTLELSFRSALAPCEVIANAQSLLAEYPSIHYIDLQYQWPYDISPDRIVIWGDGTRQEYKSHVEWIEIN